MIWSLGLIALASVAVLAWHMQKPKPRRIQISFARFVPALPPAPAQGFRLALTWPRDPLTLVLLLIAATLAAMAIFDSLRQSRAQLPAHLGLRIVFDRSHSMGVGDPARHELARARLDAARAIFAASPAQSRCLELRTVAAQIGPTLVLPVTGGVDTDLTPLPESSEPARLIEAATAPSGDCPISHVLVITDLAPQPIAAGEVVTLWDQVGQPVGNSAITAARLHSGTFGQSPPVLEIEVAASGVALPKALRLTGPQGITSLTITADPAVDARGSARINLQDNGDYSAELVPQGDTAGDGYGGDDRVLAQLTRPVVPAAEWRLDTLSAPKGLAAVPDDQRHLSPLITPLSALRPEDLSRPILITYPGFTTAQAGKIGRFRDDHDLLSAVNFDALERQMPQPFPQPLPEDFEWVVQNDSGGSLIARRGSPFGVILPAPEITAGEPARSLSLTLFYAALAELLSPPPSQIPLRYVTEAGLEVPEAWLESQTGRPLAAPANLEALGIGGSSAEYAAPLWPWWALASLAALLAERLLRLSRRGERLA